MVTGEIGIAKGIRRIIAVTGGEARRAQEEADRFAKKIEDVQMLQGKELGAAVVALLKEIDDAGEDSTLPLLKKEEFRKELNDLKKKYIDADKAQKAVKQEEVLFSFFFFVFFSFFFSSSSFLGLFYSSLFAFK